MSRQRRSTGQIINKALTVLAVFIVIHVIARLIYTFSFGFEFGYDEHGKWTRLYTFDAFFEFGPDVAGGWGGIFLYHIAGGLATVVLWAAVYAIWGLIQWVFSEEKSTGPVCRDPKCSCVEHQRRQFDDDSNTWMMVAVVAASAATTAAISSS